MAMGVAAAFGLLMSGLNGGLIQFGIALLGVCAIAWLVRRSWRLAIYGPQSGVRQNAPPVEASVRREADAVTPPNAVLFKAYVRGFFAYLSTLFLLSALAQGIAPQSGMLARASMFLPTLYIAMILLGVLRSAVLVLVKAAQHLNIRRGLADCTIGAILAGLYLAMDVIAATHAGMLPSGKQLMFDLFQMFSGAIGGFEFWRAVGAPGATRRTAMLLGRFKTGLLSGLRRGF